MVMAIKRKPTILEMFVVAMSITEMITIIILYFEEFTFWFLFFASCFLSFPCQSTKIN